MLVLKADQRSIARAAKVVSKGGIVVYPTDTVYGVGCSPFSEDSVKRIVEAKQRKRDPFPILGSSKHILERIAWFTGKENVIASKFWPGPLTLVLRKKRLLPRLVTFGLPTVGVRVPNCDIALRLIELSGGLLVGTSANLSGKKACTSALDAAHQIGEKVDLILDGGETTLGMESTIVRMVDDKIELLRRGAVSRTQIRSAL